LAAGFHPVSTASKAASLVKNFVTSATAAPVDWPQYPTVLMRGHGFTCIGDSIESAVNRAVYTCTNARVQTTAMLMQGTHNIQLVGERFGAAADDQSKAKHEDIKYLSDREAKDAWTQIGGHADRPWKLWCAEVENCSLYTNNLGPPPGA
jgi:ribulose-5-phosphate 4-epimerase/fuculose-1-phosphate aldolase